MTVINPNSISGITSITLPSGDSNVLTVHTNDGVERFRIDSSGNVKVGSAATISPDGDLFVTGVCTATTLAGSGANLTNLPAANVTGTLPAISGANLTSLTAGNLTGALPAISGANLTGIAATDNVRTGILDVAGIATFRSDVNIPNINGGQIGGRRNIIINGAMQVAQRGTSETSVTTGNSASNGYKKWADRFQWRTQSGGTWTLSQESDGPSGFNKSIKAECTTADSSLSGSDHSLILHTIEGQNLVGLKKGTTDAQPFTLSFYVKSDEENRTMVVSLYDSDNNRQIGQSYTTHGTANTWKKIELTFNNETSNAFTYDNNGSLEIYFFLAAGPSWTSGTLDSNWAGYSGGNRAAGQYNLAQATGNYLQITGVQLEVGSQATPFEHRSYGEELKLCQRYFETIEYEGYVFHGYQPSASSCEFFIHWNTEKRANPTVTLPTIGTSSGEINVTNYQGSNMSGGSLGVFTIKKVCARVTGGSWSNGTAGLPCALYSGGTSAYIYISAEL